MITVIVLYNEGNRIDNGDFILYGLLSDLHQARSQPSTDIKLSAILQSGVSKDNTRERKIRIDPKHDIISFLDNKPDNEGL